MSDETLFREVDEEVRQEQFRKLWARYGNAAIGAGVLIILGVAGMEGWRYFQLKQSEAAGDQFFAAAALADAGKTADAVKDFEAIAQTGFADLGRLRAAAELVAGNKAEDGVKLYDAIAADAGVDRTLRDIARIHAAAALADSAAFADVEARLKEFAAPGNPWRHVAREIMAGAQFRLKDYAGAGKQVQAILADPETPAALRNRAEKMSQLLLPMAPPK
ncbi:MAG: tetratricopeptide repeat protein [Aestuariivirga sp.]|uniref:tetratricopeptide repeat protein n=1 Tax=Aestuariivirga sp. TaxID=2650926 RepID=UPI0025C338C0|nr:tetratricopeptide repeat protein [Aestuariivirga sp.]MCA3561765.1 tetratricopeptide repeat protein [Aestuariivirga sp.]